MSYISSEIFKEYEEDRQRAKLLLEKRRNRLYEKLPQIKEIDLEISRLGRLAVRGIINGSVNPEVIVADSRRISNRLNKERELILLENNITEAYFDEVYRCNICQDTGYVKNSAKCACLVQRIIEKHYNLSNLRDSDESFDSFKLSYYSEKVNPKSKISPYESMRIALHKTQDFAKKFGKTFENLLIYGETGIGKTFLCKSIAKEVLKAGYAVLYTTAPNMFSNMEDYKFNRVEAQSNYLQIEFINSVDLLVIDDLGAEFHTLFTSSTLFNIINERLLNKKPTVISTNLARKDLEKMYSDRVVSRFWGEYDMLRCVGEDIRIKKKEMLK
ncbi:MAG: ATP-binding protein [Turicibacter sp.]|nr:ATP-binding protein [Turicibacter sp.]